MTNFSESEDFLTQLEIFGIKLGLDQVREFFSRIGNPHSKLKFIHIAGTNGKGSVAALLSSALSSAGFKTAFYSSPHLVTVRERFRIDGKPITEEKFCNLVDRIRFTVEEMSGEQRCPTYFEVTTAMAAMYFADEEVDFVLWETGMGGRFDATNIVSPVCSVITGISFDHEKYLGVTEKEIAFEKAGIIKQGIPVFCGRMNKDALDAISSQAEKKKSSVKSLVGKAIVPDVSLIKENEKLRISQKLNSNGFDLETNFGGRCQSSNMELALNVLEYLNTKFDFDMKKAVEGFRKVFWPGRFQFLPNGNILDGSHNIQAIKSLVETIEELFPDEKFSVIYGSLSDKDVKGNIKELGKIADEFIFVPVRSSRKAYTPDELLYISENLTSISCKKTESPIAELRAFPGKRFIITGSLYLAGEILSGYYTEDKIAKIY